MFDENVIHLFGHLVGLAGNYFGRRFRLGVNGDGAFFDGRFEDELCGLIMFILAIRIFMGLLCYLGANFGGHLFNDIVSMLLVGTLCRGASVANGDYGSGMRGLRAVIDGGLDGGFFRYDLPSFG